MKIALACTTLMNIQNVKDTPLTHVREGLLVLMLPCGVIARLLVEWVVGQIVLGAMHM